MQPHCSGRTIGSIILYIDATIVNNNINSENNMMLFDRYRPFCQQPASAANATDRQPKAPKTVTASTSNGRTSRWRYCDLF